MLTNAEEFGEFANFLAELGELEGGAAYTKLSNLDPKFAAIECALQAGAITEALAGKLRAVTETKFTELVGPDDPVVMAPHEMELVPKGAIVAIIHVVPPKKTLFVKNKGQRHLIHVLVSLGAGHAAGSQCSKLGLSDTDKWEKVNLARDLNWCKFEGSYDAIAESRGSGSKRHLRIRYRELENLQTDGTAAPQQETAAVTEDLVPPEVLKYYKIDFKRAWRVYFIDMPDNFEGWKLHVSCGVENAADILATVLPLLRKSKFHHKFLLKKTEVAGQEGKVLVIYPENLSRAFDAVGLVDDALKQNKVDLTDSPTIPNEIRVGATVVYTRYGSYRGLFILDAQHAGFKEDDKTQPYPPWITNPWDDYPKNGAKYPKWPAYTRKQQIWMAKKGGMD